MVFCFIFYFIFYKIWAAKWPPIPGFLQGYFLLFSFSIRRLSYPPKYSPSTDGLLLRPFPAGQSATQDFIPGLLPGIFMDA